METYAVCVNVLLFYCVIIMQRREYINLHIGQKDIRFSEFCLNQFFSRASHLLLQCGLVSLKNVYGFKAVEMQLHSTCVALF
jgi:hypothetical protein